TRLRERHAPGIRRSIFVEPIDVLLDRVHRCWTIRITTTLDGGADRAAAFHANAPFIDGQAVRNALVAVSGHRQPGVGEAPAEGRVLLAVVHVAVNALAVDLLHIIREEVGNVLV